MDRLKPEPVPVEEPERRGITLLLTPDGNVECRPFGHFANDFEFYGFLNAHFLPQVVQGVKDTINRIQAEQAAQNNGKKNG